MSYELIGITVLWLFLFGYIIVASIDFGAGFFSMHAKLFGESKKINGLIQRYLNPVWEVTNVFFVFFFVGIVGFSLIQHIIMEQHCSFQDHLH